MGLVETNVRTSIEMDLNKVFVISKYACYLYGVFKQGSFKVFGNAHTHVMIAANKVVRTSFSTLNH
jgi:hypothetical protein